MKKAAPPKQTPAPATPSISIRRRLSGVSRFFYTDKPLFGIDIGASSIKITQIEHGGNTCTVTAYGFSDFDPAALADGAIIKPETIAKAIQDLFATKLHGAITTHRAGFTIPASHCFIRSMVVPTAAAKNLTEAVQLEVEQYIPMPLKELYLDYQTINTTADGVELLVVAVPKKIVDSYLVLARMLDLEIVIIEPTITANTRIFASLEQTSVPTILIDFGSLSSDVMVFDKTLLTASTVAGGGDTFTAVMAKEFNINHDEAHMLKTKYGLEKSLTQQDVRHALAPQLEQLVTEIKRILRYYEERVNNASHIQQIVIMGGGANMPGLSEYLTDALRLPARQFTPWEKVTFTDTGKADLDNDERYLYATAVGVAMLKPQELFR